MGHKKDLQRFVRALVAGEMATLDGKLYLTPSGRAAASVDVEALLHSGALAGDKRVCRAGPQTAGWLKRAMLDEDSFLAQHRVETVDGEGRRVNLAENPLSRLALIDRAFLKPHHLAAADRVRGLIERAQLRARTTMNYSGVTAGGQTQRNGSETISDMAVDARRTLDAIHDALPAECAGVVMDVCGWDKGLQQVEQERGWPRRSAKLVLRIGLEQVADHLGLGPYAMGRDRVRQRGWLADGARPELRL